ncbi:PAS domain S-box protein [Methanoregula sp.]|uniref:hybrid sensor histidine kinase/response regulator n=1 Tax=Methanoregula sp. TaxID=2052170 RepID=UPI0035628679
MISTLLVDDEHALLDISRAFLQKTGEISVETADSAAAALDKFKTGTYDVIVSDYDMPGMDGLALLKKLRADGEKIPFILFTGKGREEIVIAALNNGVTFYLQKGTDTVAQYAELTHKIRIADRQYRAEQSAQESHQQIENILNFLPDPTIVIDLQGKLIVWNRAAEEMTGIRADAILEKGDYAYAVPFYGKPRPLLANLILSPNERLMSTCYHMREISPRLLIGECEVDVPGGKHLVLWVKATPLLSADGCVTGAIETFRDITERVQRIMEHRANREILGRKNEEILSRNEQLAVTEEELRHTVDELQQSHRLIQESERKYRALVEVLPDALLIHENGKIVYGNPAVCTLIGVSSPQLLKTPLDTLIGNGTGEAILARSKEVLTGKTLPDPQAYTIKKPDGQTTWVEAFFSPVGVEGRVLVQILFHDVTQRKIYEEQIVRQHDDVERYTHALTRANKDLNLMYSVTRHDILNNLTALMGFMELADAKINDPLILDYLKKQKRAAQAIYQSILFTRDYQDLGIHDPEWQNLQELVTCVTAQVNAPRIKFTILVDSLEIFADPLLEKVFYNFIDNSLRHGGDVSAVTVSFQKNDRGLLLIYNDNGVGVPDDEKSHIFERGFGKNTGLGLYLVQEILALTDITIRETGEPGHGAQFEMQVPLPSFRFTCGQALGRKDNDLPNLTSP